MLMMADVVLERNCSLSPQFEALSTLETTLTVEACHRYLL